MDQFSSLPSAKQWLTSKGGRLYEDGPLGDYMHVVAEIRGFARRAEYDDYLTGAERQRAADVAALAAINELHADGGDRM